MPNELMSINYKLIKELKSRMPKCIGGTKQAEVRIQNAWVESIYLDEVSGILYVKTGRLHDILRMGNKADAQYFVEGIPDRRKVYKGTDCFVSTDEVIKSLNQRMVGAELKKRGYLTYSEKLLRVIRESPEVRLKQEEIRQQQERMMKHLKKERMKLFKIKKDELTNELLDKKTAEFSHVRKKSIYADEACSIYNGLIVNKATHDYITKENLHDEHDLLDFAIKMKWNTEWYDAYVTRFR